MSDRIYHNMPMGNNDTNDSAEDYDRMTVSSPMMYAALKEACEIYLSQNGSKPPRGWLLALATYDGRYTEVGK